MGEETGDEDMKRPSTESPRCMAKAGEDLDRGGTDFAGEVDNASMDGPGLNVTSEEGVNVPDDSNT